MAQNQYENQRGNFKDVEPSANELIQLNDKATKTRKKAEELRGKLKWYKSQCQKSKGKNTQTKNDANSEMLKRLQEAEKKFERADKKAEAVEAKLMHYGLNDSQDTQGSL